ncbi:MAG: pyridine nucleotide-disulfide oxidoreductase [delta proteobacterium ML8_F1]|nr:MAG: pyridine nucleotide-disulfide oxidoreductase [delta proteobacterium ML8_F1]
MQKYDIIVIGMGPAGMTVSGMASQMGMKVLGIDAKKVGGECLNNGCIPSKSLLKMAGLKHAAEHLEGYGLELEGKVKVLNPLGVVNQQLRMLTGDNLLKKFRLVDLIIKEGYGRFVDEHTVEVAGVKYTADLIFIATGTEPFIPPIPGLDEVPIITNLNVFEERPIPGRLLIIGGGAIGAEMAQAFSRLGSEVVLAQMDAHLIPNGDEEAARILETAFDKEGIKVLNSTGITRVARDKKGIAMHTDQGVFYGDEILVATGRKPVLEPLNLEAAGIEATKKGITVDAFNRTNKKHIYAVGDCNGQWLLSHSAMHQGMVSLMQAMSGAEDPKYNRDNYPVPWSVFTDPEVAQVGLTQQQAEAMGIDFIIIKEEYKTYARAITDGATQGFVKVLTDLKGTIHGVTIVGEMASELIAEWTMVMGSGLGMMNILMTQHSFPTIGLLNKNVAESWMMQVAREGDIKSML